jgi:hypothetical protein
MSDWNDAVDKIEVKSGASKEAAQDTLHNSGSDVGAIVLLNEKANNPTKPPPRIDSSPAFIDVFTSVAALGHQDKGVDEDSVDKSRETPMYDAPLSPPATLKASESDKIMGKTLA